MIYQGSTRFHKTSYINKVKYIDFFIYLFGLYYKPLYICNRFTICIMYIIKQIYYGRKKIN